MTAENQAVIEKICDNFSRIYPGSTASIVSRASGRAELIGGHTDYNDGFVIATAIDSSYWVAAGWRDDDKISLYSEWAGEVNEFSISKTIVPDPDRKWANYGRGAAALLAEVGLDLKACNLYIAGNVPVGAGLSSSAALEVSIAKAIIEISDPGFEISPMGLAKICQKAENTFADSPCGIMDQMVCINGQDDHVVFLDCRDLTVKHLPMPHENCNVMIFNSMVQHEVGGGEYGKRRGQCSDALAVIASKYPQVEALRDADKQMLESVKSQLDPLLYRRASHILGENQRVLSAADALQAGDIAEFGSLMYQSHESARDKYEISCAEIDFLVERISNCWGVYGARLSGGGFGGAAVALVAPEAVNHIREKIAAEYEQKFNIKMQIYTAKCSKGTQLIQIA